MTRSDTEDRVFCVVLICVITFVVVMSVTIGAYKQCFGSSLPPVVCMRAHVLFTLFVVDCV
jgi:hypothetical protein